jgi:spore maturation protein CgeB
MSGLRIAFFGSSLVSAYWNGAATYYRGLISALAARGHRITFYEPDAYERQRHRDIADPSWARVVVYDPADSSDFTRIIAEARAMDLVVKASGVGVLDAELEQAVANLRHRSRIVAFWDVDAPATLARLRAAPDDSLRRLLPEFDLIFTYGGGDRVVSEYRELGARQVAPIYNALDPSTHYPVSPEQRFDADVTFVGNRLPDREARVEEFFFDAAARLPGHRFLLGGSGWQGRVLPPNVVRAGHVYTCDHNAINASALVVLNITRDSMAATGFSPPTRVFEAAGAGACVVTDAWPGIERFLEPGREVLVARNGADVARIVLGLDRSQARVIGGAARQRLLASHTYAHRAAEVEAVLGRRATAMDVAS